jgi:hypothetical protein
LPDDTWAALLATAGNVGLNERAPMVMTP